MLELAVNYFGNTREGSLAGPIGAFVIVAMVVVTVLLIRSMSKRIRRLPSTFPAEQAEEKGVTGVNTTSQND